MATLPKIDIENPTSGTRTTEFWVAIAPIVIALIDAQRGNSENSSNLIICGTVLGSLYIASRTLIKINSKGARK